jgi:hypothetical protein
MGGAHGTAGGGYEAGDPNGRPFGEPLAPVTPRGGGGRASDGSAGGGVVRLAISGALVLDGVIDVAEDDAPDTANSDGAGGAGGSIWITAASASGSGLLQAPGGAGGAGGPGRGGGSGGRIAVDIASGPGIPTDSLSAFGGPGTGSAGGPGTVATRTASQRWTLVLDYNGQSHVTSAFFEQVGTLKASSIQTAQTNVTKSEFVANALVGLELGIEGAPTTFTITSNSNSNNVIMVDAADGSLSGFGSHGFGEWMLPKNLIIRSGVTVDIAD